MAGTAQDWGGICIQHALRASDKPGRQHCSGCHVWRTHRPSVGGAISTLQCGSEEPPSCSTDPVCSSILMEYYRLNVSASAFLKQMQKTSRRNVRYLVVHRAKAMVRTASVALLAMSIFGSALQLHAEPLLACVLAGIITTNRK